MATDFCSHFRGFNNKSVKIFLLHLIVNSVMHYRTPCDTVEWLFVATELSALFCRRVQPSCPLAASSLTLVNTLSRLGDVMRTSWTTSACRACFPRGAWWDAPSSDEQTVDAHSSADVPHSWTTSHAQWQLHCLRYKHKTTTAHQFVISHMTNR